MIHTVKGFGIVNKAEIDIFLEISCFFSDPMDVGNLISGSSDFSKSSLNIQKFKVHVLLKPGLENFERYFAGVWNECTWAAVWIFFGIAFLWDWNESWPFPVFLTCAPELSRASILFSPPWTPQVHHQGWQWLLASERQCPLCRKSQGTDFWPTLFFPGNSENSPESCVYPWTKACGQDTDWCKSLMVLPLRGDWGFPHDLGKQDNGQEPEEGVGVGKRTPIPINSTGVYVFRFFSIYIEYIILQNRLK